MLDPNNLVRDPVKVKATLFEDGDKLITKTGCKIIIPTRWTDKHLAVVGETVRVIALFPIIVDDQYYSISSAVAMMPLTPSRTSIVTIADEECYEFLFDKGAVVCPNINLVRTSNLAYYLFDDIIAKAHAPWYLNYDDVLRMLSTAHFHADINLAANNAPMELLAATIARQRKDLTKYFRHEKESVKVKDKPEYVPLGNVLLGATNTTAKLMGNYLDDGITSALINPTDQIDTVETLFRL